MKVVFFGTPTIAAKILEFLISKNINILAVVTKPDKKRGRDQKILPTPVKIIAEKYNIPLYQPLKARDPEFVETLKALKPDVFAVAAYSEIFNSALLTLPPLGCINVHASILPKYRGAAPIERCIMAGEKESGVSIMQMVKELDAGDVYLVAKTEISEDMTSGQLYDVLSELGAATLYQVLTQVEQGKASLTPQDHSLATYAHKISAQDCEINWRQPAKIIHDQIRGLTPKPGAFCFVKIGDETKRLIIKKTRILPAAENSESGTLLPGKGLIVACLDGALRLEGVQLEGKKNMTDEEFLRGISQKNFSLSFK